METGKKKKTLSVQELDVSIRAEGEDKLIHQREIKGCSKERFVSLSTWKDKTKTHQWQIKKKRKKKMFQEENSLITSSTAGVKIKEMTMSDRSTLSCLIYSK